MLDLLSLPPEDPDSKEGRTAQEEHQGRPQQAASISEQAQVYRRTAHNRKYVTPNVNGLPRSSAESDAHQPQSEADHADIGDDH